MRALIIMCEPQHHAEVSAELRRHAHGRTIPDLATVVPFDIDRGRTIDGQGLLMDALRKVPAHTTDHPLVLAAREVSNKLRLMEFSKGPDMELEVTSSSALRKHSSGKDASLVQSRVNNCGLSVPSAAAAMLQHWTHGQIGREHVNAWIEQFGRLGGQPWMARALLGLFDLKAPSDLSELLCGMSVEDDETLCVNREPRGGFKSAEIVGNTLGKRFGRQVFGGPAEAIQDGAARRIVLFEDGLWSGTEAIGIIDSLLGLRDNRLKTKRLNDPELLKTTGVRMVYGVATDYGQALVRRVLTDRGLGHIEVVGAQNVEVAQPQLLAQMADPGFDMSRLIDAGPPAEQLRPYVFDTLHVGGMPAADVMRLLKFCTAVGLQLFRNYIQQMCDTKGWTMWPDDKLGHAAMGMHGLALAHAFGHSIPKASLPLFWATGKVELNGKSVNWRPLLPNS